ncbi:MAG: lysozyme [Armatimonadetes bacterium]|nr:lysozyme [Armatimonadota bacterium]
MPVTVLPGLEDGLGEEERNALEILVNLRLEDFNHLKQIMELDVPGVVGRTTLACFVKFCDGLGYDLSDAGVNTFKDTHRLGNTGVLRGVIGPQTAACYYDEILASLEDFAPVESEREIGAEGLALVKEFEGLHRKILEQPGRVRAYLDAVNVPTIGYGHTRGVTMNQVITFEEAEDLLKADLKEFSRAVSGLVKAPLSEGQFSALVSFAFNVGAGALAASTLLKRVNEKRFPEAANEFLRWRFAGGQELPGLLRRRRAEKALFSS